jgi:hypothetical protein
LIECVGNNADDFTVCVADRAGMKMLAQWVRPWKILLRQLAAHDDRLRMPGAVVIIKESPVQQRYLKCGEEGGVCSSVECDRQRLAGRDGWMLANREGIVPHGPRSGDEEAQTCGAYAGHGADPLQ